jgi:hypothetical protein
MNMKSQDIISKAQAVVDFAKANGFPDAGLVYMNEDGEYIFCNLEEAAYAGEPGDIGTAFCLISLADSILFKVIDNFDPKIELIDEDED